MKPVFEKICTTNDTSFRVRHLEVKTFDHPFHYHPEYELTLITAGSGHRFVGDHTDMFAANDLVLVGRNLPHCWLDFGQNTHMVSAVVIQFAEESFGKQFFELPELHRISQLLKQAGKGLLFSAPDEALLQSIKELPTLSGTDQFIAFLSVLNSLAASADKEMLSTTEYSLTHADTKFKRIDKAFDYVTENFKTGIDLAETAQMVNMTPSAFCHYFKKYTKKTFTQYVNEVRVGYACKLLMETGMNVSDICYHSGYNSLSRFNKCFKKITRHTPLNYRRQFNLPGLGH